MARFRFISLLVLFVLPALLRAQERHFQKAERLFQKLAYHSAIPHYRKSYKKTKDVSSLEKLADCYRLTHDYAHALEAYRELSATPPVSPETWLHLGHLLLTTGNEAGADSAFSMFATKAPGDPRSRFLPFSQVETPEDSTWQSPDIFLLPINSPNSDFGLNAWRDGYVFASSRQQGGVKKREFEWMGEPFLDLYFTQPKRDSLLKGWKTPEPLKGDINSALHESSFTASDSADVIFFSRNNLLGKKPGKNEAGTILLKIFSAKAEGSGFTHIEEFPFNSDAYSLTHPSLSPDGNKLYMASDMPGGYGGKDIYVSRFFEGAWTKPENAGPKINTRGDEVFPFIHANGTLYFASDGHPGYGHLDLFSYTEKEGLKNLGPPFNSAFDDFAFSLERKGDYGFLSSDRPGGKGKDDIWLVFMNRPEIRFIVVDKVAQLPVENARLRITDNIYAMESSILSDSVGNARFKAEWDKSYHLVIESSDFAPFEMDFSPGAEYGNPMEIRIELYNPPPALTAIVVDENSGEKISGASISLVNEVKKEDSFDRLSDRNGRFSVKFQPMTNYMLYVRKEGYLTYSKRIEVKEHSYMADTVIPMKLEKIPFDKTFRLESIHYDFDRWEIRKEDQPELNKLLKLLNDNPSLVIELSSHTDSRGSAEYNRVLSQKRAESAKAWLVKAGVDAKRIQAMGYGESKLLNDCGDGKDCTEEAHFLNRRTEFRITGQLNGQKVEIQSQPKN